MKYPISDLHPSYLEVQAAKAVFIRRLQSYAQALALPEGHPSRMSRRTAISCALAEVWQQGRRYQRDQDTGELVRLAGWEEKS